MPRAPLLCFLSDFGRADTFVGQCHAVISTLAPDVAVVDLTHDVAPQDVRGGAVLLARAVGHLPTCVHLAVVDPGVGTGRAALALTTARGDVLVGPDNGLLLPAARALGGVEQAFELATAGPRPVSATFHGRDVFAPAAARIAAGHPVEELGQPRSQWEDLRLARPRLEPGSIEAEVFLADRFGNLQLNVTSAEADACGFAIGSMLELTWSRGRASGPWARTFGDLRGDDLGIIIDSDDHLAVVVAGGSAAVWTRLGPGDRVRLQIRDEQDP